MNIDMIINNTNLGSQTTPEMIEKGEEIVLDCAEKMNIGFVYTTGEMDIVRKCRLQTPIMPIKRYMIPEWMVEQ